MEHGGALATGTCMLDGDTAESVRPDRCREVDDVGTRAVAGFGCRSLDMSGQDIAFRLQRDGATRAIAGRGNGVGKSLDLSVIIFDEIEVDGFGMLGGTDDTEAIASKRLCVELQTDIHILTCGRAEALTCSFGGVNMEH